MALHGAAREGHVAVVEKLISTKAKVDASGFQGHGLRDSEHGRAILVKR